MPSCVNFSNFGVVNLNESATGVTGNCNSTYGYNKLKINWHFDSEFKIAML